MTGDLLDGFGIHPQHNAVGDECLAGGNYGDLIKSCISFDVSLFNPEEQTILEEGSLLILIPQGYPDVPPDIFYCSPEIRLKPGNNFPLQADVIENHLY